MALIFGTTLADELNSVGNGDILLGLDGNDTLRGGHDNVTLNGGPGDDLLISLPAADNTTMTGGPGNDTLTGDGSGDTASYATDPAGVAVDLAAGSATDGFGNVDVLSGIENVTGSGFNDVLAGDDGGNVLRGGGGNDILSGGAGDDQLTGGAGADIFRFFFTFTEGGGGDLLRFTDFFAASGGTLLNGEVADGTSQGQFSSLYTKWLEMLVRDHGAGTAVLDLGQNSGLAGSPLLADMTGEFGERESFTWTSGSAKKAVTHERWYSDTWSSGGGGEDSVASGDGFDTITDFLWGTDQLELAGLAGLSSEQFADLFTATESDVDGNGNVDTVLAIADQSWAVTLLNVSGHTIEDFYAASLFT